LALGVERKIKQGAALKLRGGLVSLATQLAVQLPSKW